MIIFFFSVYSCIIWSLHFQLALSLVPNGSGRWGTSCPQSRLATTTTKQRFTHVRGVGILSEASNAAEDTLDDTRRRRRRELSHFLSHFQGEFDNYGQVVEDWKGGLRPREMGGHEHMHCRLLPITNSTRIACFYLDGNPKTIFRLRYYSVHPFSTECLEGADESRFLDPFAYQHIYTLAPKLEGAIRQSSPETWRSVLLEHMGVVQEADDDDGAEAPIRHEDLLATGAVEYLEDCDVIWSTTPHPVLHTYCSRQQDDEQRQFHALLLSGDEIVVPSQYDPNTKIRIKDQLSLFADTLYIHDRGRDATTDAWLYGNRRGVPYILQRTDGNDWTATGQYDREWYQAKMDAMGGPTAAAPRRPTVVAVAESRSDDAT